jgi:outer membrane receptor protein involved in Fe transport
MKRIIVAMVAVCAFALLGAPAAAQQTTGNIQGRIVDAQKAAMPGVTVTAKSATTGFARTEVTDAEGIYRLTGLPVGTYDLRAELSGFQPYDFKGVIVNLGQATDINIDLKVAGVAESVNVTAESPLIQTSSSSVGGNVDIARIESLPLNGRQFANLAATIPGVMLGYHSDPTKSTQFSPQIGGGNGRNVNYQIDGGDNNDDTVGGLLQLFPLEAVQEFQFVTSRYKAEYGRSNGGVMNVVTKTGTNDMRGSWFTLFRDTSMNALTETERRADVAAVAANRTPNGKQDYRRYQYGGSFGGPVVQNKAHFFAAFERTQQDTFQVVNTLGLFPEFDGPQPTPYRENLFTGKFTSNITPSQYLAVRYGANTNSQPYGASGLRAPNNWGQSTNEFNSINLNHNWVLGGGKLNEFIFQFADFANAITANSGDPQHTFQNGVRVGQNTNTPQATQQQKYQFRNDFSFSKAGWGGLGHDFKVGANFINEPRLFLTFTEGTSDYAYTHGDNTLNGLITGVSINGGLAEANVPLKQFAGYFQDDWRVNNRLTLNLGLRYDLITGYQIDQSKNPNFVKVQAAGAAGLLKGIKGAENLGLSPEDDKDNIQPRVGFAFDVRGDGRDVIRGGWGVYYDMGYTNANVLFPAVDATGIGFGSIFNVTDPNGIKNPDGSFYRFGQPPSNVAAQNQVNTSQLPLFGQWLDPRFELPYTRQTAFGWSHQLMTNTVFTIDVVHNQGRDLGTRAAINARPINTPSTTPRQLAAVVSGLQPNGIGTRGAISVGESEYKGLIMGVKRRMTRGFDFTATYTLADSKSNIGTAADELNQNNIQDIALLYDDPRTWGPTGRTDARHSGTLAAVWVKKGLTISPIFTFRAPLPIGTIDGRDLNSNSVANDLSAKAYQFTGFEGTTATGAPLATFKELGTCETWNCSRGAWRTQLNLRMSYNLRLIGSARAELIGEVFNVFNAKNPGGFNTAQFTAAGAANSGFMQPTTFAGDFQAGEQRVGQIGFRFSF